MLYFLISFVLTFKIVKIIADITGQDVLDGYTFVENEMAPIRYSLHYEDYSDHLMSRFGKLLQMQSLVDMTLMCSSHTLRVHKVVLAASSAYFQEVLQKQNGEPLIILKMRFSVLKCLVEFMYCGKTQCLEENLDELVSAAQFLKIKGLSKVTKEGLGITNQTELPIFTPPVVINRPPKSLLEAQDNNETKKPLPLPLPLPLPTSTPPADHPPRLNKDSVVRIPFDIDPAVGMDYSNATRVKPRRGRPSARRSGGWEPAGMLGRAAERALLRREQDSRKAIHQLKHLQSRQMQDYMDRVTLSQAVNSICGQESSNNSYMNIDTDLLYMDQAASSNILGSNIAFTEGSDMGNETITSSYSQSANGSSSSATDAPAGGISAAMSQYVNALKNAGLPTDLPILFESGDGSYINVNEQVLLDMVQSSEIQYEVIEQPNIIEKVADPTEIKSIDELSKSIERGEMLMNSKNYVSNGNFDKESSEYIGHDEAISSLNAILPDNLESFSEQQNYVVLNNSIQESNNIMNNVNPPDFSCIVNDMQFFTKSMNYDMKNYYEDHQCSSSRTVEQMCPTSTGLDTNFNISFLDTKVSHFEPENMSQDYNPLNTEDLRRNEDGYDFGLQLAQSNDFKDEALDCLMATPKRLDTNYESHKSFNDNEQLDLNNALEDTTQAVSESQMADNTNYNTQQNNYMEDMTRIDGEQNNTKITDYEGNSSQLVDIERELECIKNTCQNNDKNVDEEICAITSTIQWDSVDNDDDNKNNRDDEDGETEHDNIPRGELSFDSQDEIINLIEPENNEHKSEDGVSSTLKENIPFAVGLLPLAQGSNDINGKKRNASDDELNVDAKYLKRKVKYKKN